MNTNKSQVNWEQPAITVDVLVFTIQNEQLKVLLIKRGNEPFKGMWAIPGGFIRKGESIDDAAFRVSQEKTEVKNLYLEQLCTFGEPKRDPRKRVVSVAYFALIPNQDLARPQSTKVEEIAWFNTKKLPALAFDHKDIIKTAVARLQAKVSYSNIVLGLLPLKFRLSELQLMYETILDHKLDKRNFRKKILSTGLLQKTGEREIDGAHRPAMLYRFKKRELVLFD